MTREYTVALGCPGCEAAADVARYLKYVLAPIDVVTIKKATVMISTSRPSYVMNGIAYLWSVERFRWINLCRNDQQEGAAQ